MSPFDTLGHFRSIGRSINAIGATCASVDRPTSLTVAPPLRLNFTIMKTRVAGFSAVAAASTLLAFAPAAHASTPAIGKPCSASELGNLRYTTAKQPTVCANTGRALTWVRTGRIDPVTHRAGQPCSGKFPVADSPTGKALLCANGRWSPTP